jgi:ATP-dependent Lon protease
LSQVFFIATANDFSMIPSALADRMDVIQLSGYTVREKVEIAQKHLLPQIIEKAGLEDHPPRFSAEFLEAVIKGYTLESGVRSLKRKLSLLIAKYARAHLKGEELEFHMHNLEALLGPARGGSHLTFHDQVGVTNGLAWSPVGGNVLQIEGVALDQGHGSLKLTGQLGSVMQESAQTALSYILSNAGSYKVDVSATKHKDIHIHVPDGATPKDGPSAGVTMATTLYSLFTGQVVRSDTAMTGEINLRGEVKPIGGVAEKILAAKRVGLKYVLVPEANRKDVEAMKHFPEGLEVKYVSHLGQVFDHMFRITETSVI